jgi:hypothetical protein
MDPLCVWQEFLSQMREETLLAERICPYDESLLQPLQSVLSKLRPRLIAQDTDRTPEIFLCGNQVHYILPLRFEEKNEQYKPGAAGQEQDWRTWLAGIEYSKGKPYLFALLHLFWEP